MVWNGTRKRGDVRWTYSSARYYKVIVVAHSSNSFYDFALVVCDYFDSFEVLMPFISLASCTNGFGESTIPRPKQNLAMNAEFVYGIPSASWHLFQVILVVFIANVVVEGGIVHLQSKQHRN